MQESQFSLASVCQFHGPGLRSFFRMTIRYSMIDRQAAPASDEDVTAMRVALTEAIKAGAMGFSTSRSASHLTADDRPVPSRMASSGDRPQTFALCAVM